MNHSVILTKIEADGLISHYGGSRGKEGGAGATKLLAGERREYVALLLHNIVTTAVFRVQTENKT